MNHKGRFQASIILLLLCGLCSCTTGSQEGLLPGPVWLPEILDVKVPSGTFIHGDTAEFSVNFFGGRNPIQVSWDFDGGATPDQPTESTDLRTLAVSVVLINETAEPVTYAGTVSIRDSSGSGAIKHFTFRVDPAPAPEPPAEDPDGETPPDDGETPPDDSETPPDDGETPPDDGETPPDDGETPPDDGETPPDDGETPPDDGETPPDDDTPPVIVNPPPPPISWP